MSLEKEEKSETEYIRKTNICIYILSVVFLIIVAFVCSIVYSHYNDTPSIIDIVISNIADENCITLEKFESIKDGMTYAQVARLIGEDGELLSHVDIGIGKEYVTDMYVWYGRDKISNANVTFQAGKVTMKAQIGLK